MGKRRASRRKRRSAAEQAVQPASLETEAKAPAEESLSAPTMLLAALLVCLVVGAYWPTLGAGYIWDDDSYVTDNPNLGDFDGLVSIWFDTSATPQYYPLVHTTFWVEHQLWGLKPAGYHFINVLLHVGSALLLWRLLVLLRAPVPWLIAAVFGLHPVCVESVAWITERKNTLSLFLYLSAMLAYLRFAPLDEQDDEPRSYRPWYFIALALFLAALLSKTVVASLPVALLLLAYWHRGRVIWRDIVPTVPMFVMGAVLGLHTAYLEKHQVGAEGEDWALTLAERVLVAGKAVWFYAEKLVWPQQLTFIYPRWQIDSQSMTQYVYPLAAVLVVCVLFALRRHIGRGPFVCVALYICTLSPALGFFDIFPFQYSFVADHFQYHASIFLLTLLVGGAAVLLQHASRMARVAAGGLLLVLLGTLTWTQTHAYVDQVELWTDTINKNESCWMAYNNLANMLALEGQPENAIPLYLNAAKLRPEDPLPLLNAGWRLMELRQLEQAEAVFRQAMQREPKFIPSQVAIAAVLRERKDYAGARSMLEHVFSSNPNHPGALAEWEKLNQLPPLDAP